MSKATIINRSLAFQERLIGTDYSQPNRLRCYKGGSLDCSSLQAAAMAYAGFPLLSASGGELTVSNNEVYAVGWNLIYPSTYAGIGQTLPSLSSVVNLLQRGDLVFYNFNGDTNRANKITHIGAVRDAGHLIQTANNTVKLSGSYPITWGATRVCAIIRLKDTVERLALPTIKLGAGPAYAVRVLQAILNHGGESLYWEGNFGGLTEAALKRRQTKEGRAATGVCDAAEWKWLLGESVPPPLPAPTIDVEKLPYLSYPNGKAVKVDGVTPCSLVKVVNGMLTDVNGSGAIMAAPIRYAQWKLSALGIYAGKIDGQYGAVSDTAMGKFKSKRGLDPNLPVGRKTWIALIGAK